MLRQGSFLHTAKNTVISPNFLVWKFCEKAEVPHSFGRIANRPKICRNCAFPQNFNTRKLGEIALVFFVVWSKNHHQTANSRCNEIHKFSRKSVVLSTTPFCSQTKVSAALWKLPNKCLSLISADDKMRHIIEIWSLSNRK